MRRTCSDDSFLDEAIEDDGKDRQFVTALARGLEVLRVFGPEDGGGLGNQEIAERTGLPKPTISRLTYTLTKLGYLVCSDRSGRYRLGTGVMALGFSLLAGMDIRQRARPLMQDMARRVNASVSLGSRDRLSMVYVETCRGEGAVTLRLDVGSRLPLATTAMGRAFLAGLPPGEREQLLDEIRRSNPDDFPRIRAGIDKAVDDLATRGFTVSAGDWQSDVHAVGVPLIAPGGSMGFALNCGGPSFLLPVERLENEIGPELAALARALSAQAPLPVPAPAGAR